ncbi:hypothetical protein [Caulobacter mirabilis]|uniref:hypothetical protein n=1 Tax=Caulobacter mirabilis TaxID=69666 RepID=UPI001558830C|nr:hypothetical protein [Caulobacter mirabilis]
MSDFQALGGLSVLRDGAFAITGKLSTPLNGLCVPLRSAKYADEVNANPRIVAVITRPDIAERLDSRLAVAVTEDPDGVHSELHVLCAKAHEAALAASPTRIHPDAHIDPDARVAPYGVDIGPGVHVAAKVVIAAGVTIEDDCIIHPGVALGVSAFNTGIVQGRRRIIPSIGGVRLRRGVEILANSCIAKAIFGGETTIGEETVTDNLVYIAHDCQIGRRVQICALVNVLGRVVVGDEAYLGPSAVIVNGVSVGARAKVSIGAVVTQNVPDDQQVSGNFAIDHQNFLAHMRQIRG